MKNLNPIHQNEAQKQASATDRTTEAVKATHAKLDAVVEAVKSIPEPAAEIAVSLKGVSVVSIKGDKGDKGAKGEKGDPGKDGKDGTDGRDGVDGKGSKGDRGVKGDSGPAGKDGKDGADGKDGKDGSTDTVEQISEKINSKNNHIDFKTLFNIPDFALSRDVVGYRGGDGGGGQQYRISLDGTYQAHVTSINFEGATYDGNGTVTVTGGTVDGSGTANEITYWVDSNTIGALAVATYPSLTELSYVKGVTSPIQTQIDAKFTLPSLTSGSVLFSNGTTIAQDNTNLFWDDTNNRLGVGANTFNFAGKGLEVTGVNGIRLNDTTSAYFLGNWTNTAGQGGMSFYQAGAQQGAFQMNGTTFGTVSRRQWMEFVNVTATGGVSFWTNVTQRWNILSTGHLVANTDNTLDIGASGATRPRTGYFGTSVITPSATVSGLTAGRVTFAGTGGLLSDDAGLTFAAASGLTINQATLGNAVQKLTSTATNDDPTKTTFQQRVATTDATVTTIATVAVPSSTTIGVSGYVVARRTGGTSGTAEDSAFYRVEYVAKNVAGTATITGSTVTVIGEDQVGWDVTVTASGGNTLIRVTGAADNNITWHVTWDYYPVSS